MLVLVVVVISAVLVIALAALIASLTVHNTKVNNVINSEPSHTVPGAPSQSEIDGRVQSLCRHHMSEDARRKLSRALELGRRSGVTIVLSIARLMKEVAETVWAVWWRRAGCKVTFLANNNNDDCLHNEDLNPDTLYFVSWQNDHEELTPRNAVYWVIEPLFSEGSHPRSREFEAEGGVQLLWTYSTTSIAVHQPQCAVTMMWMPVTWHYTPCSETQPIIKQEVAIDKAEGWGFLYGRRNRVFRELLLRSETVTYGWVDDQEKVDYLASCRSNPRVLICIHSHDPGAARHVLTTHRWTAPPYTHLPAVSEISDDKETESIFVDTGVIDVVARLTEFDTAVVLAAKARRRRTTFPNPLCIDLNNLTHS